MFLRNCWYVIAWAHEIPEPSSTQLFHRTVLGDSILVYRQADGMLAALENRCCHRLAPLSKGRREGDCIRCGYHGLMFESSGRCVEVPGTPIVPQHLRVRRYPVVERNKWIFVWMGDAERADEALLPDNFSCDHPDWTYKPGYMHYDVPQQLICDNLLDFSHLSYVHASTLGGASAIAEVGARVQKIEHGVRVDRFVPDVPASPFWKTLRHFEGNLDRWFIYDFVLPGTLLMETGGRPAGQSADDPAGSIQFRSCQTVTPETETSTHYFFQQSHSSDITDPAVTQTVYDGLIAAFIEDRDIISAQYASILLSPGVAMVPLAMDSALLQFRRLLESRLLAERNAAGVGAAANGQPNQRQSTHEQTDHPHHPR